MAITLSQLCANTEKKYSMKLIAGHAGMGNTSVPSQAIVFCEQNGFPLFTIPWKTRIIDISYEFCRRIIANEKRESTIADAFRGIIRNPATADDYSSMLNRAGFYDDSPIR